MATDWRIEGHPLPGEDPLDASLAHDPEAVQEAIRFRRVGLATDHPDDFALVEELLKAEVLAAYGPAVWADYTDRRARGVKRSPRAQARSNARLSAALDRTEAVLTSTTPATVRSDAR